MNKSAEQPFYALPDYNILSMSSGRAWGVMTPSGVWTTFSDLTPSERSANLPTAVLPYHRRETAERIARRLTKRAKRAGDDPQCS